MLGSALLFALCGCSVTQTRVRFAEGFVLLNAVIAAVLTVVVQGIV
jgi:hypothetical protein